MSKFDQEIDDALDIIKENGTAIPIAQSVADFDPVAGKESNKVTANGTIFAVVLPASKGTIQAFDNRILDETTLTKLRFLLIAAKGRPFDPVAGNIIEAEGRRWEIVGSTPLAPDGEPILFKAGAKLVP